MRIADQMVMPSSDKAERQAGQIDQRQAKDNAVGRSDGNDDQTQR